MRKIIQVAIGGEDTLALADDGTVWAFDPEDEDAAGDPTADPKTVWRRLAPLPQDA